MDRSCYVCGVSLLNEPALQGLRGLLCFPCRFGFDEKGGEAYLHEHREFAGRLAEWTVRFGDQWPIFRRRMALAEKLRFAAFLSVVGAVAPFAIGVTKASAVIVGAGFLVSISAYVANQIAQRIRCEPPPEEPLPDKRVLSTNPTVVFDSDCISIGVVTI